MSVDAVLQHALRVAPKLQASDGQLLLRESYEQVFGIFDHRNDVSGRDLAVMGLHPAEDAHTPSLLYERIEQYFEKDVFKYTGLTPERFLELPRDIGWKIFEECDKKAKRENQAAKTALENFNTASRPTTGQP